MNECSKLAERFNEMKRDGLVDVKFFLQNTDDVTQEMVCGEVLAMLDGDYVEMTVTNSFQNN